MKYISKLKAKAQRAERSEQLTGITLSELKVQRAEHSEQLTKIVNLVTNYTGQEGPFSVDMALEEVTALVEQCRQQDIALQECARVFRQYEAHHANKPDPEKATANSHMASMVEGVLNGEPAIKHPSGFTLATSDIPMLKEIGVQYQVYRHHPLSAYLPHATTVLIPTEQREKVLKRLKEGSSHDQ